MDDLTVTRDRADGAEVLAVAGELDLATVPELESAISAALEDGDDALVLDLTDVQFIDSTAVALLLRTRRALDGSGRRLAVVGQTPPEGRLFALESVDEVLGLVPTRAAALAAVGAS